MSYTVKQLAAVLGLEFQGDGARSVTKVSGWESADSSSLIFLDSIYATLPPQLTPAAVIATRDFAAAAPPELNVIFSAQPKLDFAKAAALLLPLPAGRGIRHATAQIAPGAIIGDNVDIGPFVVIAEGAHIGANTILSARVTIGRDCVIGAGCVLHPGVTLYSGATLGERVVLHAGVVVGSDGFGYVHDGDRYWKFPQSGGVIIEDDVEVGANTTIDRGSLGITRVGAGSKIDNLVQIAHNVQIGRHVVIASQTGISGSTIIEDLAVIGGQVGFGDHARVQKGVVIGSKAGILPGKIVRSGEVYWGVPVRPLREYKRLNALFGRLPDMKAELERLKAEVEQLRKAQALDD